MIDFLKNIFRKKSIEKSQTFDHENATVNGPVNYRIVRLTTNNKYIAQVKGREDWLTLGAVTGKDKWQEFLTFWSLPFESCYMDNPNECHKMISFLHRKTWEPRGGKIPKMKIEFVTR